MPKSFIGWVALILFVFWVVSDPSRAGTDLHNWVSDAFTFLSSFAGGGH